MEDIEGIVRTALFIKLKMFRQEEINLLWTWITQSSILALDKTDFFILMNFMEGLEQALGIPPSRSLAKIYWVGNCGETAKCTTHSEIVARIYTQ
tara:strand:+ start:1207 stop:1491 length:285 start_codon:yes stop_codon:yes gene_type:complete